MSFRLWVHRERWELPRPAEPKSHYLDGGVQDIDLQPIKELF